MSPVQALLREAHRRAIEAVDGRLATRRWLQRHDTAGDWHLVALGKAAPAMARGAVEVLGAGVKDGLVVTREGYGDADLREDRRLQCIEAAHPVPDERSIAAGNAVVDYLRGLPHDARVLFLISGGTSSLVERLPEGANAAALSELNRRLLADGLGIQAMNRIRRAVSTIKGGRLARFLDGREARVLLISDVQGDDPAVIGSGLLFAAPDGPSTPEDVPEAYRALCPPAAAGPCPGDPVFDRRQWAIVASNAMALEAAARCLREAGHDPVVEPRFLSGEAADEGRRLGAFLRDAPVGAWLWGGEPVVTLPPRPGRGGRMQALALAAAAELDGAAGRWLLAAGTDGADGPGDWAGAIVDGDTVPRGRGAGHDWQDALARADAGTYLESADALFRTGPTGTNVMDVVIGVSA